MDERPPEISGSLLTIGDEILLGDILNGNARHIALELRNRGFRLDRMITVGDREEDIVSSLVLCLADSRFIIVTGGLGPTDDDRTNAAVSRAFDRPLVADEAYVGRLKERLAERGQAWSNEVAKMAELPAGAVKIGMDMAGFFIDHGNVPCYFLPGVPGEMKFLLSEVVIPDLDRRFPRHSAYLKEVVRVQGMVESEVNRRLRDLDCRRIGVEIGYLPQGSENWVTLFSVAASEEECRTRIGKVREEVVARLGEKHISGRNDECLEKVVGEKLRERGWRMAAAESCTGGLLSTRLTSIAGSSGYFDRAFITYSNQAKQDHLGVSEEMLRVHGAVSEPVALAMAEGACRGARVEVALGITGIAGPAGGSAEKPVGTVYIACVTPTEKRVEKHRFEGVRESIRQSAAQAALLLLWRVLTDDSNLHCH